LEIGIEIKIITAPIFISFTPIIIPIKESAPVNNNENVLEV